MVQAGHHGRRTPAKQLAAQVAELEALQKQSRPEKPHLKTRGKAKSLPSKSRPDKPWLFTGRKGMTRGERNVAWIEEYLRVPEGAFAGRPLKLPEFMRDDLRAIYDNPAGTRRAGPRSSAWPRTRGGCRRGRPSSRTWF
jgi:hypothetical protein